MGYFFKVFLVLAVLSHYSYPAKKSEEAEGNCSSFVVSPQKWTAASIGLWTDPYSFCTGQTPFQRSCFLGQNPCCNPCSNDEEASFLEVLTLPCCDEGDVPQMLEVWNGMASMQRCLLRAAGIQAGLRPADRAAHAMDGNFLAIAKQRLTQSSHTKPEAQPTWTSTRRRATLSGPRIRQGTATDANASNGAYDDAVSTAYDATPTATTCGAGARAIYYDGQRDRQGHESSCGDAGGMIPPPPPMPATGPISQTPGAQTSWASNMPMMPFPAAPAATAIPMPQEDAVKEGKAQKNLNRLLKEMKKEEDTLSPNLQSMAHEMKKQDEKSNMQGLPQEYELWGTQKTNFSKPKM